MIRLLIVFLALFGAVAFAVWHTARKLKSRSKARGADARDYFSNRSQQNDRALALLDGLDDPRLLAACALAAIANSDGDLSENERAVALNDLMSRIGLTLDEAADLLEHGRVLVRDVSNLDRYLNSVAGKIRISCDAAQLNDISEMALAVLNADGVPGDIERIAVQRFANALAQSEA